MYTHIKIHESFEAADKQNRTPKGTLFVIETTEAEHDAIRHEYEAKTGQYAMNNSSLDYCWWLPNK